MPAVQCWMAIGGSRSERGRGLRGGTRRSGGGRPTHTAAKLGTHNVHNFVITSVANAVAEALHWGLAQGALGRTLQPRTNAVVAELVEAGQYHTHICAIHGL